MNKQQLASKIWESANKMRSKIEANEYKDYILGFIFYKFLSETEIARLKACDFAEEDLPSLVEGDEETVEFVKSECGYFIAYENLFSTWVAKGGDFEISNVRDALNAFSRNIDPARKRVFDGIFDTLRTGLSKLGTDARSQSKASATSSTSSRTSRWTVARTTTYSASFTSTSSVTSPPTLARKRESSTRRTRCPCS